jgi:hypothetical protein
MVASFPKVAVSKGRAAAQEIAQPADLLYDT